MTDYYYHYFMAYPLEGKKSLSKININFQSAAGGFEDRMTYRMFAST